MSLAGFTALDFSRGRNLESLGRSPFSLDFWHGGHLFRSDKLKQTPNKGVFWKCNGVPLRKTVRNNLLWGSALRG